MLGTKRTLVNGERPSEERPCLLVVARLEVDGAEGADEVRDVVIVGTHLPFQDGERTLEQPPLGFVVVVQGHEHVGEIVEGVRGIGMVVNQVRS